MIFDCDGVEQAREKFPQLRNTPIIEINTIDGPLVLFTKEQLTPADIKFFQSYTKKEIMDAFQSYND